MGADNPADVPYSTETTDAAGFPQGSSPVSRREVHPPWGGEGWRVLAWVEDLPWACQALQFACRHLGPQDDLVLLAVCARGREGDLECGRMQLERAVRACAGALAEAPLRLRLAVGDPRTVLPRVAAEERADLVVTGAAEDGECLHGSSLDCPDWIAQTLRRRPLLVGSPRGIELLAGEECLLIAGWREVPPLSELQPMTTLSGAWGEVRSPDEGSVRQRGGG